MKRVYQLLDYLRRRPEWLWLPVLVICFFLLGASYNYYTQSPDFVKWVSPDETANYLLAKQYAVNGKLMFWEKYNVLGDGILMPRSFRSDGALLKPVSFLGVPLIYGALARVTGIDFLPYLTPVIAALGLIFFYLLIARIFSRPVAAVSVVLLAFFPVYLYFTSHSFFHNVPFLVFFLISLYLGIRMTDYPDFSRRGSEIRPYAGWILAALAGGFMGWAVACRTSELLWLLPLFALLWLFNLRRVGLVKLFFFLFFALAAYSPVLYWNSVLYGAPLASGYPNMDKSINTIVSSGKGAVASVVTPVTISQNRTEADDYMEKINSAIFVFGFNPEHSFKMAYYYFWRMFPWLIILAGFGLLLWLAAWRRRRLGQLLFIMGWLIASIILLFYYGSWVFYDNPDPNSFTIGNSYTRYWLPIYLGLIPFAAYAIVAFSKIGLKPLVKQALRWSVVAIVAVWSMFFLYYGSEEGLAYSGYRQIASRAEWAKVLSLTEGDSVIVTRYHDKLLFPERMVIVGLLTDANMNRIYAKLAARIPVYYYNFKLAQADLDYLNSRKLKDFGLSIEKIANITENFTLYRLRRVVGQ